MKKIVIAALATCIFSVSCSQPKNHERHITAFANGSVGYPASDGLWFYINTLSNHAADAPLSVGKWTPGPNPSVSDLRSAKETHQMVEVTDDGEPMSGEAPQASGTRLSI